MFTELTPSGSREVGHEDCDNDHPGTTTGCGVTTERIAIEGDTLVLVGDPLRTVPL
ncbi:MAG: hypothetical protein R3B82_10835 [Sandaracinaceae bacterium]